MKQTKRLPALLLVLLLSAGAALAAGDGQPATVHKASIEVRAAADASSPGVAKLKRNQAVAITGQEGLWYRLQLADGGTGFVRINDVRIQAAAAEAPAATSSAMFSGNAGRGRVSETATVRGINPAQLRKGGANPRALARMEAQRVDADSAAAHARSQGWQARQVAYPEEARAEIADSRPQATRADKREALAIASGLLGRLGGGSATTRAAERVAERAVGKSPQELAEEELALGPALASNVLAAAPLWENAEAQRRVNLVGRWLASQTSRPDLPWTFAVIDDADINAYAAPGGYVLVTRGLYELLDGDAELAAVLAHEIPHVVQRDHYEVIRKQQLTEVGKDLAMEQVRTPGAAAFARDYVERNGAAVLLSGLDRNAEYHADRAAGIYLARAGFDPLAFYSVLQKMAALGTGPARLAQLQQTHPPLSERMDRLDRELDGGGRRRR